MIITTKRSGPRIIPKFIVLYCTPCCVLYTRHYSIILAVVILSSSVRQYPLRTEDRWDEEDIMTNPWKPRRPPRFTIRPEPTNAARPGDRFITTHTALLTAEPRDPEEINNISSACFYAYPWAAGGQTTTAGRSAKPKVSSRRLMREHRQRRRGPVVFTDSVPKCSAVPSSFFSSPPSSSALFFCFAILTSWGKKQEGRRWSNRESADDATTISSISNNGAKNTKTKTDK